MLVYLAASSSSSSLVQAITVILNCFSWDSEPLDAVAVNLVKRVYRELKKYPLYKNAKPTL